VLLERRPDEQDPEQPSREPAAHREAARVDEPASMSSRLHLDGLRAGEEWSPQVLEGDAPDADVDEFDRGVAKAPCATLEAPDDA